MAIPVYSIYLDGKIQNVFPNSETKTADKVEAEGMFNSMKLVSCSDGSKLELRVSSRGLEKTLKEEAITMSGFVSDTEQVPEYHCGEGKPTEQELFLGLIRELYDAGFSVPEISDISGKSERTVRYNLSKLKAVGKVKSHGRGRPADNETRNRKAITIQIYDDNYDLLMKQFGNLTSGINELIDRYRETLVESEKG